ncbi:RhoGAP-domain-containing protein [Backusella circina FSU 941]|nr:RhoGAP-domain-containing protein [Backusella circina FSU 941]
MTTTNKRSSRKPSANKNEVMWTDKDKELIALTTAPSRDINKLMEDMIKDSKQILEYLKQKIELEETHRKKSGEVDEAFLKTTKDSRGLQATFANLVELNKKHNSRAYLDQLQAKVEQLTKFLGEQDKQRLKNKSWMKELNNGYMVARAKKYPLARDVYNQKWEEIERSAGASVASPILQSPATTSIHPLAIKSTAEENEGATRNVSIDSTRTQNDSITSPSPLLPQAQQQQSRLDRLKKQFAHLKTHEDPTKQNIKMANLKMEVGEADTNYRKAVREINTLALRNDVSHKHILNTVQKAIQDKSELIKSLMEDIVSVEVTHLEGETKDKRELLNIIKEKNAGEDCKLYCKDILEKKYPKHEVIYYENYHVGICKDLIFGTSLAEYAQQHNRSPPIFITRSLEAIEKSGGLEREGIYRVSGKQSNMEKIKHAFEMDEKATEFGKNEVPEDVFSIASVVKVFLRELETPLFPFKLADRLLYSQIPDQELRLMNLLTRLLKLPPANYDTLRVLICHLTNIANNAEKNKMTISNLTLIFTPAIFQDMNHAQIAPGEWSKDCCLEDLITNYEKLFANKDFHNNSAITGTIENISDHPYESKGRYALSVVTPDSPTFDSFSLADSEEATLETETLPERAFLSRTPSPEPPVLSESTKKYQDTFQEKGLKLDTVATTPVPNNTTASDMTDSVPHTSCKSATVPSEDWLNFDPEAPPVPLPRLRRQSTTGKKLQSRRKNSAK